MPTFQFEAMDPTGQEIRDVIEAASQDEAQATIRQMGYFVTKIAVKKSRKTAGREEDGPEEGQDLRPGRRQPKSSPPSPASWPSSRTPACPSSAA